MSKGQVIITCASRGIGEAIAVELDRRERIGFLTGETIYVDGGHGANL